jgi:cbb3-type cytochrome oxidase cytochrome c subunit/mono/diheme cytochrome c family protein
MAKTDDDHAYNIPGLNVWFAISSVLLALGVVWMVLDDYTRDWKRFQRDFNRLEYERTRKELDSSLSDEDKQKLESLRAELDAVNARLQQQNAGIDKARREIRDLDAAHYRVDQDFRFAKSLYDSARYEFEERARRERAEAARAGGALSAPRQAAIDKERAELDEQARKLDELHEKVLENEKSRDEASARLKAFTDQRTRIEKEIDEVRSNHSKIERTLARISPSFFNDYFRNLPVLDFLNPSIRIQQVVLDRMPTDINFTKIPRVDRCATCHLAIDRKGYEDLPQPFTSHPRLDLFLSGNSPHALESFGCTVCHLGRDRGTSFIGAAHTPGSEEQRAEWQRKYGWHEFERWETPMLARQHVEATCYKCHKKEVELKDAPALRRGITLIEDLGCHGCHKIQGFESLRKVGPDLTRTAAKLDRTWSFRWIRNPRAFRPYTKMPRFFGLSNNSDPEDVARTDVEIDSILEYLYQKSQPFEPLRGPGRGDARRGREVIESAGCLGCHRLPEQPKPDPEHWRRRTFGPELGGLGSKTTFTWLYSWLKNPKHYWPETRMPSLRLTDQEAADAAAYLIAQRKADFDSTPAPRLDTARLDQLVLGYLTLKQPEEPAKTELARMSLGDRKLFLGQRMIQRYGCFGCHRISGFESSLGIGTELTEEGSKAVHRLDFGFVDIEPTLPSWVYQKMMEPRIFDQGKVKKPDEKLKMPSFEFDPGQATDVVTAILAFTKERLPLESVKQLDDREQAVEAGRRLVKSQNCQGCHILEGEGGDILEWIAQREGKSIEEIRGLGPPMLQAEGKRVQPAWLFGFLKQPSPIRPWIKVRMPTFEFDDAQATALTRYFAAADRVPFPFETRVERALPPAELAAARRLASPDYLDCFTCHQQGARKPQGPPEGWAPDLALAHDRLRADWIVEWLQDPQRLLPGTRMPTYFADENSGPDDLLGGDEHRQIRVLTDYIMSLGRPAAGGAAARGR